MPSAGGPLGGLRSACWIVHWCVITAFAQERVLNRLDLNFSKLDPKSVNLNLGIEATQKL
jgi:hypothetical protein